MGNAETFYFWSAVAFYVIASLISLYNICFNATKGQKYIFPLAAAGFALHTAAIAARWIDTGHPPIMRNYENALAGAWGVMVLLFGMKRTFKGAYALSSVMLPFAALMMGYAVMNMPTLEPMTPAYKTPWFVAHIVFAWFAYCSFVASFALGILYLLKERKPDGDGGEGFLSRVPGPQELDELCGRFVAFGFVTDTVMLVAGSIWASKLWGSYWSWDPIETWSLLSWLVYGIYLHLRHVFRWRGRKLAIYAILALITVIASFWGVNFTLETFHNFQLM